VIAEVVVGRVVTVRTEVRVSIVPLLNIIIWTSFTAVGTETVTTETGRLKTSSVAKTSTSQPAPQLGSVGLAVVVTVLVTVVTEPDILVVKTVVVVSSVVVVRDVVNTEIVDTSVVVTGTEVVMISVLVTVVRLPWIDNVVVIKLVVTVGTKLVEIIVVFSRELEAKS
jgi:hypothetical protein